MNDDQKPWTKPEFVNLTVEDHRILKEKAAAFDRLCSQAESEMEAIGELERNDYLKRLKGDA